MFYLFQIGIILFLVVLMHLLKALFDWEIPFWFVIPLCSLGVWLFVMYARRLMNFQLYQNVDEESFEYLCAYRDIHFKVAFKYLLRHGLLPQLAYVVCLSTGHLLFPLCRWFVLDIAAVVVGLHLFLLFYLLNLIFFLKYLEKRVNDMIEEQVEKKEQIN